MSLYIEFKTWLYIHVISMGKTYIDQASLDIVFAHLSGPESVHLDSEKKTRGHLIFGQWRCDQELMWFYLLP